VPKWSIFGALFEYFGTVFAKNGPVFAKIEQNEGVFDNFQKDRFVFALTGKAAISKTKGKDLQLKISHELHPSTSLPSAKLRVYSGAGESHEFIDPLPPETDSSTGGSATSTSGLDPQHDTGNTTRDGCKRLPDTFNSSGHL